MTELWRRPRHHQLPYDAPCELVFIPGERHVVVRSCCEENGMAQGRKLAHIIKRISKQASEVN